MIPANENNVRFSCLAGIPVERIKIRRLSGSRRWVLLPGRGS